MRNELGKQDRAFPEISSAARKHIERLTQAQAHGGPALWQLIENYRLHELNKFGTSSLLESELIGNIEVKLNEGQSISPIEIMITATEIEKALSEDKVIGGA